MKFKLLIVLLLTIISFSNAQSKQELEAKDFFWGANDAYKNANEIPDKWKGESAVIIYKNINYDYHKFAKKVKYKSSIRKRILLLDKNAVKEFSEFSFTKRFRSTRGKFSWRTRGKVFFAIKIIKPDGTEIEVNVDKEAVKSKSDYKVAISNLEVGDIIDYYYYLYEPFTSKYEYTFAAVEQTLSEEYPIMDFKLYLESENDFFINFKSLNGAPELKEIPTDKRNFRKYELNVSDIEKKDFPMWFYPLLETPSVKFQVYFARSGKFEDRTVAFLSKQEKDIKTSVSKEEVLELYKKRFRTYGNVGDIKSFLKGKTFSSNEAKVKTAYYYMRHYYLTRFMEAFYVDDANILAFPFTVYGYPVFIRNQKQFIKHFTEFLKRNKIPYEIVVGTYRYNGTIQDLLIENNVEVLVKVKTKNPLYAQFFSPHTNINQFASLLHGTDVYLLSSDNRGNITGINNGTLPNSDYKKNVSLKQVDLDISEDFTTFTVISNNKIKGYNKISEQYDRLLFTDYVYEDYAKYQTKSFTESIRKKKVRLKTTKELNALISKLKKDQIKEFETDVANEFDVSDIENYEYKLVATGRYGLDTNLEYNESFTFKNQFIKKAGPNYIIEIGKFIGGQIEMVDEQRERNVNIYMRYPRTFNYEINLKIPNGYKVAGLDKLNKNVTNTTGAFISTAKVENGFLKIQTSKQYKHNYEPKENWNLILAFLDEANQFKNEKILLKKI